MKLCQIDRAVLEAHAQGRHWKTVRGIKRERQFANVLRRAQWREKFAS